MRLVDFPSGALRACVALLLWVAGCGGDGSPADAAVSRDSGSVDGAARDSGIDAEVVRDAGLSDAATRDVGPPDAAIDRDGATRDAACTPWTGSGLHLDFDDAADGELAGRRYASQGVLLARPGGEPVAFSVFPSPASPPNYVMGEYEDTDLNPGSEFGNDEPALPITITFVDPDDATAPATTTAVSLQVIYTNADDVTRLEAFDTDGVMVAQDEVTGVTGDFALTLSVSAPAIHEVRVVFDAPGSTGLFEDSAGIDDLDVEPLSGTCP